MVQPNSKRKTRSDKFPLTLHKTGQFCKKIKGKLYYFGNDKKKALARYIEQAPYLHTGKAEKARLDVQTMTLKTLCNLYLDYQNSRVQTKEITARHYVDEVGSLKMLARFFGPNRDVAEITALDLQNYKRRLTKAYAQNRTNLNLAIMKAIFHWAQKNDVLKMIPNIAAVSKVKIVRKEKTVFTADQVEVLLRMASLQIKTMIWLGLNCGFGSTDCSELLWNHVNLEEGRVRFPRIKTGIDRNLPLWPETIQALKKLPQINERVFNTKTGQPWVRISEKVGKNGEVKYVSNNALVHEFSRLIKKAGIKTEKGVGFYTLRRTAATLAVKSGDPFAVQKLLGQADLKMASVHVQDVSEQTDRVT